MFMSSIWTEPELRELIAAWKQAWLRASTGKSYTIDGRTLTRYDLDEIEATLGKLQDKLSELESGSGPWLGRAVFRRPF